MVAVAVGQEDGVAALGLELRLGAARIAVQERIDVDALATGRVETEGRVPEPGLSGTTGVGVIMNMPVSVCHQVSMMGSCSLPMTR